MFLDATSSLWVFFASLKLSGQTWVELPLNQHRNCWLVKENKDSFSTYWSYWILKIWFYSLLSWKLSFSHRFSTVLSKNKITLAGIQTLKYSLINNHIEAKALIIANKSNMPAGKIPVYQNILLNSVSQVACIILFC